MKNLYILIIFLINFSYGQAVKQDKTIRASMVYGYFTGIETALANISELNPNFRSEVNQLNLLLTTNFGQSKKNAVKYLSLPKVLGVFPATGKNISVNIGRFGPYIVHDGDFRSIKEKDGDNPYDITLERAIAILNTPKVLRKGRWAKKKTG